MAVGAYVGLSTLAALNRLPERPAAMWVLLANALIIVLLIVVHRARDTITAVLAPLFLLPLLYGALEVLTGVEGPVHDTLVQRWEAALFGSQVSVSWWQSAPSRFWSALFHSAYLAYYFIIPFPPLYFLWRGRRHDAERAVGLMVVTFLACYAVFMFFPVAGPYYAFPRPDPILDNLPARLVYQVLSGGSTYGAAFPSSHVAGTVAATVGAAFGARWLGVALAVPTALLTLGVVYCQMHYAVDAIAGIGIATIAMAVFLGVTTRPDEGPA